MFWVLCNFFILSKTTKASYDQDLDKKLYDILGVKQYNLEDLGIDKNK